MDKPFVMITNKNSSNNKSDKQPTKLVSTIFKATQMILSAILVLVTLYVFYRTFHVKEGSYYLFISGPLTLLLVPVFVLAIPFFYETYYKVNTVKIISKLLLIGLLVTLLVL